MVECMRFAGGKACQWALHLSPPCWLQARWQRGRRKEQVLACKEPGRGVLCACFAGGTLRIRGRNMTENEYIKLNAYHTLELEVQRPFTVSMGGLKERGGRRTLWAWARGAQVLASWQAFTCVCACVCAYVSARMCACVCVRRCLCACVFLCVLAFSTRTHGSQATLACTIFATLQAAV